MVPLLNRFNMPLVISIATRSQFESANNRSYLNAFIRRRLGFFRGAYGGRRVARWWCLVSRWGDERMRSSPDDGDEEDGGGRPATGVLEAARVVVMARRAGTAAEDTGGLGPAGFVVVLPAPSEVRRPPGRLLLTTSPSQAAGEDIRGASPAVIPSSSRSPPAAPLIHRRFPQPHGRTHRIGRMWVSSQSQAHEATT